MKATLFLFVLLAACMASLSAQCDVSSNSIKHDLDDLEINQRMDMTFYSDSDFDSGFILKSSNQQQVPVIYQGAIWMGGIDANNNLRVSANQYLDASDYTAGVLDDSSGLVEGAGCENWNQGFSVTRSEIDNHIADFDDDSVINGDIAENILYYPAIGNQYFPDKYGWDLPTSNNGGLASFKDRNANGIYEPKLGDYPLIRGSESTFWISNDMHDDNDDPIGMEFLINSSINTSDIELAFSSMIDMKAIYHGTEKISEFYFGLWIDADLGCIVNDQVGCLPDKNLSFYYGTETTDCTEGAPFLDGTSPLLLFKHKMNNDDKMAKFISINREGISNPLPPTWDPQTSLQFYNYLKGVWLDGQKLTSGNEGYNIGSNDFTDYQYDHSENLDGGPWKACDSPLLERDKRTLVSFGPYDLNPGDILDFEFSVHLIELADLACPTELQILDICEDIDRILNDVIATSIKDIQLYPNPATSRIIISSEESMDELRIFSITGAQVYQQYVKNKAKIEIDVSQFEKGVYFLQSTNRNNLVFSPIKFVKI